MGCISAKFRTGTSSPVPKSYTNMRDLLDNRGVCSTSGTSWWLR